MNTELLTTDDYGLQRAAELLRSGEIVAIPTETVYGLAALPNLAHKLNELKGSPSDKPITWLSYNFWHDAGIAFYDMPTELLERVKMLFENHATVILPCDMLGAKDVLHGFRKPANKFAYDLLYYLDAPLACTSANMSSDTPALDAAEVLRVFDGKIAAIVDGGPCEVGVASAVVDFSVNPPKILRYGSGLDGDDFSVWKQPG